MVADIPEVSFVRIIFIACGTNEMVLQIAAAKPMPVIISIADNYSEDQKNPLCTNRTDVKSYWCFIV